ncbi:hypothetical protein IB234_17330 [Pseudomonas sp. PDM16]|nr:hypothetical protein [Pseudomonas sp. PDM16]MBD9416326.1 hypothetical protein [Pseudomonas sp. PDM16]
MSKKRNTPYFSKQGNTEGFNYLSFQFKASVGLAILLLIVLLLGNLLG